MKVLSLFDGISCGRVALERVTGGILVERYVAYEIDPYAVKISEKNYPSIEHYGDVFEGDFTQYKGFDLLLGGSPCTFWSVARKDRETTPDGIGGQLFMQYVRALKEASPKYFLYENNYSIHQDIKDFISKELGVEPVMINSSMVSAQLRKRCYWTNIPNVIQPEDRNILLKDIIESGIVDRDKSLCMTSRYAGYQGTQSYLCRRYLGKKINQGVFRDFKSMDTAKKLWGEDPYFDKENSSEYNEENWLIRRLTPVEAERLQTLPDNYTEGVPDSQRYKCIGNGWTVDVISHILKGLKEAVSDKPKVESDNTALEGLFASFC